MPTNNNSQLSQLLDCLKTNYKILANGADRISLSDFGVSEDKIRRFCRINKVNKESLDKVFLVVLLSVIAKEQVNRFSPSVISEASGVNIRLVSRCLTVLKEIKVITFWGKAIPRCKSRDARLNIPKKKAKSRLKIAFRKAATANHSLGNCSGGVSC